MVQVKIFFKKIRLTMWLLRDTYCLQNPVLDSGNTYMLWHHGNWLPQVPKTSCLKCQLWSSPAVHIWKCRLESCHWHFNKVLYFNNSSFKRPQQNWCQGRRGQHTGNSPFDLNFGVSENSHYSLPARTVALVNNYIWSRLFPGHNSQALTQLL